MAQFDVNNNSVDAILSWIKNGEIAIPEIQRPFVWDAIKVRDLIDSLYHGYPCGYIITWKNPNVKLKDGTISKGKKVLIDGQQRVTALQAALIGTPILDSNYKKKRITISFNPLEEKFEVCNPAIQKNTIWINDISDIFAVNFSSFNFVMNYCKTNHLESMTAMDEISNIINKLINIKNINLGVIELSDKLDIERVTEIFIRINSKGVVLSQADFAMSKISSNDTFGGNNIRKIIDYFCHFLQVPADYEMILENDKEFAATDYMRTIKWIVDEKEDIYEPDYSDVLRVAFTSKFNRGKIADLVSLLSGRNFETRINEIEIEEASYKTLLDGVLAFVNKTNFQRYLMIMKSVGIVDKSLIRSKSAVNFGYTLYLALKENHTDAVVIEKVVRRWLALSMLTGRYSGSPESWFDYDIKRFTTLDPLEYLQSIEDGELSDAFWNNVLITRLNTSVASSPIFNIFLMAQIKANDRGFLSEQIDVKSLVEERGDIHHIFPKNYLKSNGVTSKGAYNQIANYVYTQSEINIKIKDTAPKTYMEHLKNQCETKQPVYGGIIEYDNLMKNLSENAIPEAIFEMDIANFNEFLEQRRILMAQKIKDFYFSL